MSIIASRREFMVGLGAALIVSPAAAVQSSITDPGHQHTISDPLCRGINYQTWPFGTPRPETDYFSGHSSMMEGYPPKPMSHWIARMEKFAIKGRKIYWEIIL